MKEQGKNPPDLTNEEEIGSLPEKEFRIMIVKMIESLGNRKNNCSYNNYLRGIQDKGVSMTSKT